MTNAHDHPKLYAHDPMNTDLVPWNFHTDTRSLRDRVTARLTHLDLGSYDIDWLDYGNATEISYQLRWLDETAAECRVEGDLESADAYDEVLEIIQIETQKYDS